MTVMDEFDGMLEGVLFEAANPLAREGFGERLRAAGLMAGVSASDGFLAKGNQVEEEAMATGVLAGGGLREVGVLGSLWESLRDVVMPLRVAPLVLESVPIAVTDRMAVRREMGPVGWAIAAHAVAMLAIGFAMAKGVRVAPLAATQRVSLEEMVPTMKVPARALTAGGGGGQKSPTPAALGRLPKFAETQIAPPKAPPVEQPKISVEPTVVMQKDLKMAESALPNLGMPNSMVVGTGSLGNGSGTGIGSGYGSGVGAGSGGNTGGGAMRIGGGVSAPVPISMPDPQFSEEARKAKMSGNVLVYLWVDQAGRPTHVRVLRGIGMGLDEKALEAVKEYRFKPARKDGVPVTVEMNVEVGFQIF